MMMRYGGRRALGLGFGGRLGGRRALGLGFGGFGGAMPYSRRALRLAFLEAALRDRARVRSPVWMMADPGHDS